MAYPQPKMWAGHSDNDREMILNHIDLFMGKLQDMRDLMMTRADLVRSSHEILDHGVSAIRKDIHRIRDYAKVAGSDVSLMQFEFNVTVLTQINTPKTRLEKVIAKNKSAANSRRESPQGHCNR